MPTHLGAPVDGCQGHTANPGVIPGGAVRGARAQTRGSKPAGVPPSAHITVRAATLGWRVPWPLAYAVARAKVAASVQGMHAAQVHHRRRNHGQVGGSVEW